MTAPFFVGTLGVGTALVEGVLSEPIDPSYARQPIGMLGISGAQGTNSDIVAFYPEQSWGTIGFFAIFAPDGVTVQWSGPLNSPVATIVAQQIAFLPGAIVVNNLSVSSAVLFAWAPNPQRLAQIDAPGITVRNQAQSSGPTAMASRAAGATCDDTIDISGLLAPGDLPALGGCSLSCSSPDISVAWCSFQGSLIIARSTGGAAGATYNFTLTFSTVSGASESDFLTQYVDGNPPPQTGGTIISIGEDTSQEIPALGTNSATAQIISASVTRIDGGTGGGRIQNGIPPEGFAFEYKVINDTALPINIYPPSGLSWIQTPLFTAGTDVPYSVPAYVSTIATIFASSVCILG